MTGIYKIENLINHKKYIGQAVDIQTRWKNHRSTMNDPNDKGYDYHLYRSMRKYGIENFSFTVIEECLISELNDRERYWIAFYDSFFNGYNLTFGGDSSTGRKNAKEYVIGVITDLSTTDMKHHEIAEKWNVSTEMVQGINTGRYWKHDREYPIQKRIIRSKEECFCCDCGKKISQGATRCRECDVHYRQTLNPSTMTASREELKSLIRIKSFCEIGKMFKMSDNAIRKWCIKYNLPSKKSDIKKYTNEEWAQI